MPDARAKLGAKMAGPGVVICPADDPDNLLPDPADNSVVADPGFEDRAYPLASPETRARLRALRETIREILESPFGRQEGYPNGMPPLPWANRARRQDGGGGAQATDDDVTDDVTEPTRRRAA